MNKPLHNTRYKNGHSIGLMKWLILLIAGLHTTTSLAQEQVENWYTVEVISFSRAQSDSVGENWLSKVDETGLVMPQVSPASLELPKVPSAEWQLARHAYSIGRSPGIKIRSHQAWRQPGLPRAQAPWVALDTGGPGLGGSIRISLSRFLHAEVDIRVINPDANNSLASLDGLTQPTLVSFRESRRMRLEEIHYLDHPLAGVLVRIERYTPPETGVLESETPTTENPTIEKPAGESPAAEKTS